MLIKGDKRRILLQKDRWVQSKEDPDNDWERPSLDEDNMMMDFLQDRYRGAPKRFYVIPGVARVGYDAHGVFIMMAHQKRYWGIERATAGLSLQEADPEAVPLVHGDSMKIDENATKTQKMLKRIYKEMPNLSDDMRYKVLSTCFAKADANGNGFLSRAELGTVMRRITTTLSGQEIENILREADKTGDGKLSYKEFVTWLQETANPKFQNAFTKSLQTEPDIVRATFRMWDRNGDGMIARKKLVKALMKVHPDCTEKQLDALTDIMDKDDNEQIDYDEFVDFLFSQKQKK